MKKCIECWKQLENRNKTWYCCVHVKNRKTHWMSNTPTYKSWSGMKSRCLNNKNPKREYYWWSGITICDDWLSFWNFLIDMWERPLWTSIDRIDNQLWYSKNNCRRANNKTQWDNRKCVRHYKWKNMTDWDLELWFRPWTMRARITTYWREREKAITIPKFKRWYRTKKN